MGSGQFDPSEGLISVELKEAKPGFNLAVNGFRGLCVLMVFIYHIENSGIVPVIENTFYESFRYFLNSFKYGVEMFFMISGYVIVGSLMRHSTAKKFFVDRAIRIFPTWVPVFIVSFIGTALMAQKALAVYDPINWTIYFFAALFFLPPVFPFPLIHAAAWSLSYEWCFYIIAGIFTFFMLPRFKREIAIVLVIVIAGSFITLFPRALFFVPGILAALYPEKMKAFFTRLPIPFLSFLVFLFAWQATGIDQAKIGAENLVDWVFDARILYLVGALVAGIAMFSAVVAGVGYSVKALVPAFMQFYGNISYAFYLWSPLVMFGVKAVAVRFVTPYAGEWVGLLFFAIFSLILSTFVSWLNYVIVEKKFAGYLKRKISPPERMGSGI